jgi:(2Fe-2S) ferredoxin
VQPTKLHPAHDALSPTERKRLLRDEERQKLLEVHDVKDVLVLICGHGGRDMRCGVMGPALKQAFETVLPATGIDVLDGSFAAVKEKHGEAGTSTSTARIGLISHIGGHKFAGNVILYIPPGKRDHALAGYGIWYGRVQPKHVEGIIQETILGGRVIEELFRGGIKRGGEIIRL